MEKDESILIVTPGGLPFPSVKGGAVQNLIEHIVKGHEKNKSVKLYVSAPMDKEAKEIADNKYKNTNFIWVKIPKVICFLDNCVYGLASRILKNKKTISFRNNFKIMWYTLYLSLYLRRNNFKKVVIENNIRLFWALKLFGNKRKYKDRYYFHLHNIPRSSLGCRKEIEGIKKTLCISNFQIKKICSNDSKINVFNKENTTLLKNCIDLSIFNNNNDNPKEIIDLKNKYNIDDKTKILVFTGRISEEKGVLETIKAFNNLKIQNIKLLIVGATYYNSKMTSQFEKKIYNIAESNENIIFTGYIDYEEIKNLYQIADIAILPSMWEEPAGLTMIEAMACGTPVISTKSGGIPEYLHDDCAILLDRDENIVQNIEKNIIELLNNKEKSDSLIEKGLKVASEYDSQNYYNNFLKSLD